MHRRPLLHAGGNSSSARTSVIAHLVGRSRAVMIPYAQSDHVALLRGSRNGSPPTAWRSPGVHTADDPGRRNPLAADAVFVTGGNSFRLVRAPPVGLIDPVVRRSNAGSPTSAPARAPTSPARPSEQPTTCRSCSRPVWPRSTWCPFRSIRTTSIRPPPRPASARPARSACSEFLEENDVTVVGAARRELARRRGPEVPLGGTGGAVVFRRGTEPASSGRRRSLRAAPGNAPIRRLNAALRELKTYICLR